MLQNVLKSFTEAELEIFHILPSQPQHHPRFLQALPQPLNQCLDNRLKVHGCSPWTYSTKDPRISVWCGKGVSKHQIQATQGLRLPTKVTMWKAMKSTFVSESGPRYRLAPKFVPRLVETNGSKGRVLRRMTVSQVKWDSNLSARSSPWSAGSFSQVNWRRDDFWMPLALHLPPRMLQSWQLKVEKSIFLYYKY